MTVKEIAEAVGRDERSVRRWINKASDKMSGLLDKLSDAEKTKKATDYTEEETLFIIEVGLGKNAAGVYRANAANKNALATITQPQKQEFAGLMNKVSVILEENQRLITESRKALEDPRTLAFKELEEFINEYLVVDERRMYRVHVSSLYSAYEKEAEYPLNEREFMYKIALDHPEFDLKFSKGEWVFHRCWTKRMI